MVIQVVSGQSLRQSAKTRTKINKVIKVQKKFTTLIRLHLYHDLHVVVVVVHSPTEPLFSTSGAMRRLPSSSSAVAVVPLHWPLS